MESDAISLSLEKSVSFEVITSVTQGGDHAADQNVVDDDEDQGQVIGNVQESK